MGSPNPDGGPDVDVGTTNVGVGIGRTDVGVGAMGVFVGVGGPDVGVGGIEVGVMLGTGVGVSIASTTSGVVLGTSRKR
jgi:hypothetical protein